MSLITVNSFLPILFSLSLYKSPSFYRIILFKQMFCCAMDDLVILSESQAGLQNSLNKLEKYCYKWQLTVNTNKTKIMIF
jgi:hypothetical protein